MKKSPIVLVILLLFCFEGFSQHFRMVNLDEATITTSLNQTYRNLVYNETTPEYVQNMQSKAANYDIRNEPGYNNDFTVYEVIFKQTNGSIIASYDTNGKMLSSLEKFTDVTPPQAVRNSIVQNYPGWTIHRDLYRVSYFHNKEVSKIYQIQLRKGNMKKNLKVDSEGQIL